jgi:hypothetical protein
MYKTGPRIVYPETGICFGKRKREDKYESGIMNYEIFMCTFRKRNIEIM